MADRDSTPQEEQYERELNKARDSSRKKSSNKPASQTESKQTMPQRIGSGKLGRFGRAAMLAGGIITNVNPAAAEHAREKAIYDNRSDVNKNRSAEVMPAQQTQNPTEQAFGKNATVSENTQPTTVNYDPNQTTGKQKAEQTEAGAGVSYMNLRRKLQAAKKLAEGGVTGAVGDAVNKVAQLGSARALSWAWIAVIPTCGLSLLYINFHFVAHYVASSEKFCKFGDEWAIKKMASGSGEENPLEEVNQMIEKFEIFGMFVLDAVVIFLIVIIKIQMDLSACLANNPVNTVFDPDSCYTSTNQ